MAKATTTALAIAPAVVLAAVAVWEAVAAQRDARDVPGDAAWDAAATVVRAGWRPGDLIVFAPDWVDPVGRLHLGDLITLDMAGRMDAARYPRIWELAIRGAHAPEVAGLRAGSRENDDGVSVTLYEQPAATVVTDFATPAALAGARVVPARPAPAIELAEVGFAPHRCVQVTPQPGKPTSVSFPQATLGTALVGYVGLADIFTRRDIRAPGELGVEIGGKRVATVTPGVDDGWVRFEVATTPGAADVTFVASATAPQRLICFAAEARK